MEERNCPRIKPRILEWLASHKGMISLRESLSATGEELRPLFGRTLDAVPFIVSQGKMQVMKYLHSRWKDEKGL